MKNTIAVENERSNAARLQRAKEQFSVLLDEMDIWIDEAREDTFCAELFNFSLRLAELAAMLGFDQPPCERELLIPFEDYRRLNDIRDQAQATRLWMNPPYGKHGFAFGFTRPLSGMPLLESDSRLHSELRAWIGRWRRAVKRVDPATVRPASAVILHQSNPFEAGIFDEQRRRELAGDPTSFYDEMHERVAKVFAKADREGLAPDQTSAFVAHEGRSMYHECVRRRMELPCDKKEATEDVVPVPPELDREPREALRMRAETQVRDVCDGKFPGVRPLARALGCETRLASLNNAITSSKYLSARKAEYDARRKANPTEQRLTDVHCDSIPQSTEPDPLATLIKEQQSDDRNDERMARAHARRQSR